MAISKITGSALDKDVIMKDVSTADGSSPTLTLQTGDTNIEADDVLGTINFQAPDEGTGTDAILVAAGIAAVSEGDFSASSNATKLSFRTGASETATEKMTIASTGATTITTEGNENTLSLISTDADAAAGPNLRMYRNSASPADVDEMGNIRFVGRNDNSQDVTYGEIEVFAMDVSDGTEDGLLNINTVVGGTVTSRIKAITTETVINDDSADLDFRVESDGNANMFIVDAGNNIIGIGRTPDTNDGGAGSLQLEGNDGLAFRRAGQTNSFILRPIGSGDGMRFTQGGTGDLMTLLSDGTLLIGKTASNNATEGTGIEKNGAISNVITSTGGASQNILLNRHSADGKIIQFRQANSNEGDISVSGSTISYNGFSGLHESSGIPTNTPVGTVVSTIDELDVYPQKQIEDGEEVDSPKADQTRKDHPKVKVSDTEGDACVYGVVGSFTEQGKVNVVSVGIGSVRVTGACSKGDLLESNGDGTAKVQSDDIIKSKTIGKVTIGNSSTDVKLVSCVMYCG